MDDGTYVSKSLEPGRSVNITIVHRLVHKLAERTGV